VCERRSHRLATRSAWVANGPSRVVALLPEPEPSHWVSIVVSKVGAEVDYRRRVGSISYSWRVIARRRCVIPIRHRWCIIYDGWYIMLCRSRGGHQRQSGGRRYEGTREDPCHLAKILVIVSSDSWRTKDALAIADRVRARGVVLCSGALTSPYGFPLERDWRALPISASKVEQFGQDRYGHERSSRSRPRNVSCSPIPDEIGASANGKFAPTRD
jgi:hypothetical protein